MVRVFRIKKYREWWKTKKKLNEESIDNLIYLNEMNKFDDVDQSTLEHKGHIILDEWCEEVKK